MTVHTCSSPYPSLGTIRCMRAARALGIGSNLMVAGTRLDNARYVSRLPVLKINGFW